MPTAKKDEAIAALREKIGQSTSVFFTDFRGLTVGELRTLRTSLRKANAQYEVVKNTLFGLAIGPEKREQLTSVLAGPTAVAFTGSDPVGPAKALTQFASDTKKLTIKAALVDGAYFDPSKVEALSKVPGRPELMARLVGSLHSPIARLHGALKGHHRRLVYVLSAVHSKKSESAA
ncbi:MAG TPA: 50S ribosomal protein L10 [Candidatus Eremiobacteraceae bacterium]|nr:50S ribosomal protein L10 [Candidatus Eremiobacteraceae bacterium]